MKNKTAGERKRTITVVIGPKTLAMLEEVCQRASARCINVGLKPVDFVGSYVTTGVADSTKLFGIPLTSGWEDHFD